MGESMEKEHEILDKLISKAIVHYFKNVPFRYCLAEAYEELTDEEKVIIDEKIDRYVRENIDESKRDIKQDYELLQEKS